jgi:hypothetical protein
MVNKEEEEREKDMKMIHRYRKKEMLIHKEKEREGIEKKVENKMLIKFSPKRFLSTIC